MREEFAFSASARYLAPLSPMLFPVNDEDDMLNFIFSWRISFITNRLSVLFAFKASAKHLVPSAPMLFAQQGYEERSNYLETQLMSSPLRNVLVSIRWASSIIPSGPMLFA